MDEVDYRVLLEQLIRVEGAGLAPYRDATGNLIVAPDHYIERMGIRGFGMAVVEVDVHAVVRELEERWPLTRQLDAVRKRVLIHMGFNMGVPRLLTMTRFVSAVESRAWDTAANEMLNSEWANREPHRTSVMAAMMRTGRDDVLSVIHPKTA